MIEPPVFSLAIFKNNDDTLENRENQDYCISEGDLILKCKEANIYPIVDLVQKNPFCAKLAKLNYVRMTLKALVLITLL